MSVSSRGHERFKALLFFGIVLGAGFGFIWMTSRSAQSQPASLEKPGLTQTLFGRGEAIYRKQCLACHGREGAGDGKAAFLVFPKPRNFQAGEFRLISTSEMKATDEDLFKAITRGMPGSAMPPWGFLPAEDRWALVYYVRYLSELGRKKAAGEITDEMLQKGLPWEEQERLARIAIDPEIVIKVPEELAVTPEGIERGRALFLKGCASCHGPQGRGDGQMIMKDSQGVPIKPRDLTSGIFKGSSSSEDLYFRLAAGLPGSPMPAYQLAFTAEELWDLIHYVQTLPKPGAEERSRLTRGRIVVKKSTGDLSADPVSDIWESVEPVSVILTPLWWRDERIDSVEVKTLHDGKQAAIHLSWADPTQDDSTVRPQSFSDGAALQFSTEKDPPFFAMGEAGSPVHIWHWKASWQKDLSAREDIETAYPDAAVDWYESETSYRHGEPFEAAESKTQFHDPGFMSGWGAGNPLSNPEKKYAAEEAMAQGIGSLTTQKPQMEPVEANGVWKDGKWNVVFRRALTGAEEGTLDLKPPMTAGIAFAVWDGSKEDRNGQKMISIWNELVLED